MLISTQVKYSSQFLLLNFTSVFTGNNNRMFSVAPGGDAGRYRNTSAVATSGLFGTSGPNLFPSNRSR